MRSQRNFKTKTFLTFGISIKVFLLFILVFSNLTLSAQRKGDKKYVSIPYTVEGQDQPAGYVEKTYFWGSSFDYAVYEFSNILWGHLTNKREQQRLAQARQQSLAKLQIIKSQYSSYESYPETITDGWHSAIATDNINFCKNVKVLINDNRIVRFIVDNYIPLNFMTMGEIKDAKNVVTLKNFNEEQLNIVEVFFLYDIEEPTVVPEPIKPGYVCFWSDIKYQNEILLDLDNQRMERLTVRFNSEPDCFSNGMVCRILKPGTYSYLARGKGAISWEDTFEVKENQCLKIKLSRLYTY